MKIAISSTGEDLNAQVDPRFGRCTYFIVVETEDMSFETCENENAALNGGVGIQSASFIISKNVKAVLTGNCGPKAIQTFTAGNVDVFTGQTGTVEEAVERFKNGSLRPSAQATVVEKSGLNELRAAGYDQTPGVGRCMGGTGRGMGMGRGRGMRSAGGAGFQKLDTKSRAGSAGRTALSDLKAQAANLGRQMEAIQAKIKNMEKQQ
jgi:predicted Fe-Mo cluster-binding NifX family protein